MNIFSQLVIAVVLCLMAAMAVTAQEPAEHDCDTKADCNGLHCCKQPEA